MSSAEQRYQGSWLSKVSKRLEPEPASMGAQQENEEELDANDLEVAMINESFEEQMKHSLLFTDSNLKSLFYGAPQTIIQKKHSPDLGIDEAPDFKMDPTPPLNFLPPITPPSSDKEDEEFDRGKLLDRELERMMLEGEEEKCPFSESPLLMMNCDESLNYLGDQPQQQQNQPKHSLLSRFFSDPSMFPDSSVAGNGNTDNTQLCSLSFDLHQQVDGDDQQDSSECTKAAESIAFEVISSLFADEHKSSADSFSVDGDDDEEESLLINSSILQVLQDDETEMDSENEDDDDGPKLGQSGESEIVAFQQLDKHNQSSESEQPPLPSRNDSMQTISSPSMCASDEQTVPVIDSWEEIGDSPVVAEKVYSEAKAVLKKMRAERKATQL